MERRTWSKVQNIHPRAEELRRVKSKVYRSLTILLAAWLLLWLWLSWPAMQDDALIHLRYAVNLLQHHMISYDGVHPDYGTSSLLYVWLLAGLRTFFTTPLLPRAVSSVFHVALFVGIAWAFAHALRSAPRLAWGFASLLLVVLVMPMAVRWLDDGMETSLALCLVALIAFAVSRLGHSERVSTRSAVWLFALGLVATLTRVEYLLLLGVASLTLFLERFAMRRERALEHAVTGRFGLALRCTAPLLGSLLGATVIFFAMHALTPDTAIAKGDDHATLLATGQAVLSVLISSASLGMGLLVLWLLTATALTAYQRRVSLTMLVANSPFPLVVVLAALHGQQVQGVRYFLWTLLFPILWNTLELRWKVEDPGHSIARALSIATYTVAGMLLILAPIESKLLYREFRARETSLAQFRVQHLERLHAMKLVAFDIGYIGYFTDSPLCDMAGLVNGRVRAALPFEERVRLCVAEHPQYAFVSNFSLAELSNALDLKGWSICSVYDFANLRGPDLHYLIASPAATAEVCAAAGAPPQPLEPVLHPVAAP
jgi:hypothetical protein